MSYEIKKYIDENETIYVMARNSGNNLSNGSKSAIVIGLNDLGNELSGQSTVFVNKIRFAASGFIDPDGTDFNKSFCHFTCGIVPDNEYVSSNAPMLEDYQEVKGWPLKGCFGYSSIMMPKSTTVGTAWQGYGSRFSWTRTYSPRKALVLSRLQQIVFNMKNDSNGSDINYLQTIELQLKRGD